MSRDESEFDIFVCYPSADKDVVMTFVSIFKATGLRVFFDKESLRYGENWEDQIDVAIIRSERMLVFWSKSSSASAQIEREWRLAAELQRPIVPIVLDSIDTLPAELAALHGVDAQELLAKHFVASIEGYTGPDHRWVGWEIVQTIWQELKLSDTGADVSLLSYQNLEQLGLAVDPLNRSDFGLKAP